MASSSPFLKLKRKLW